MSLRKAGLFVILQLSFFSAFTQNFEEKIKKRILVDTWENKVIINSINIQADKSIINKVPAVDIKTFSNIINDTTIKIKVSKTTNLPVSIETPRQNLILTQKIKSQSVGDNNQIKIKSNAQITSLSIDYFKELQPITGDLDPQNNLELKKVDQDIKGNYHNLFQQKYKGIKIYGNEVVTHLNSDGQGFLFNGRYDIIKNEIDVIPKITFDSALKIIIKGYNGEKNRLGEVLIDTFLFKEYDYSDFKLIYRIFIQTKSINEKEYLIDADKGNIIRESYTSISIATPRISNLPDLNGVTRSVKSIQESSQYQFIDATKLMYNSITGNGIISVKDANFTYYPVKTSQITNTINSWTPLQVSAQYNASVAYDYYLNAHNRNSIDGNGMSIFAYINVNETNKLNSNFGGPMDNAKWSPGENAMFYGNGNTEFKPLAGSLDVAGHEMTHGVVQYTVNLDKFNQPGAINESLADVFGVMIDSSNWTIGEDIMKSGKAALRDLSNPHNFDQPMHMSEFINTSLDQGGVHINSGIPNYAFYLFAKALGRTKAAKIYYGALQGHYLTSQSNFQDLRNAIINSSKALFTNSEAYIAAAVFDSVGIYDGVSGADDVKLKTNIGPSFLLINGVNTDTALYSFRSNTIKALNRSLINSKISVTDNGRIGYFVGKDKKVYSISTDTTVNNPINLILSNPYWSNVSVSRDGKKLALVSIYQDTLIYVLDLVTNISYSFKLFQTNFNNEKLTGPLYADAIEWDYSGQNIIYDCYNKIPSTDGLNDKYYWDINILNVWDSKNNKVGNGNINKIFNVTEGFNLGNPTISKKSPNIIAFDYYDQFSNVYSIMGYNMNTGRIGAIKINNSWGYPTYNANDDSIYFSTVINSVKSISSISINSDKISVNPSSVSSQVLSNAKLPVIMTIGNRAFTVPPTPIIASSGSLVICNGDSVVLNSDSKSNSQWYRNGVAISGEIKSSFIAKITGFYSVKAIIDSVFSEFSPPVLVFVKPVSIPPPPVGKDLLYCQNMSTDTLRATALIGNSLLWYSTSNIKDSSFKSIPIPSSINLGKTDYYVSQKVNTTGCEGPRLKISVIIDSVPSAPIVKDISLCQGINASPIAINPYNGNSIFWYTSNSTSGSSNITTITPNTATVGTINYFVTQINNASKCESSKSKISVIVNPTPSIPTLIRDTANYLVSSSLKNVWFKDGVLLSDSSTRIKPIQAGLYSAKSSQNGCISSLSSTYYYLITDIINLGDGDFIRAVPNPILSYLYIEFVLKGQQNVNIELFNISNGNKVATFNDVYSGTKLQVSNLSSGVYVLRVSTNDNKKSYQFKMVKL
jgi:Zn-dependent metalloprotease